MLDRNDCQTIDDMLSKSLAQLKNVVVDDIHDYINKDLPELINDICDDKKITIVDSNIIQLAQITQLLMELSGLVDDFTYEQEERK